MYLKNLKKIKQSKKNFTTNLLIKLKIWKNTTILDRKEEDLIYTIQKNLKN